MIRVVQSFSLVFELSESKFLVGIFNFNDGLSAKL